MVSVNGVWHHFFERRFGLGFRGSVKVLKLGF